MGIYGLTRSVFVFCKNWTLKNENKTWVQLYRFGVNGLTWRTHCCDLRRSKNRILVPFLGPRLLEAGPGRRHPDRDAQRGQAPRQAWGQRLRILFARPAPVRLLEPVERRSTFFSEKALWAISEDLLSGDLREAQGHSLLMTDVCMSVWHKFLHTS